MREQQKNVQEHGGTEGPEQVAEGVTEAAVNGRGDGCQLVPEGCLKGREEASSVTVLSTPDRQPVSVIPRWLVKDKPEGLFSKKEDLGASNLGYTLKSEVLLTCPGIHSVMNSRSICTSVSHRLLSLPVVLPATGPLRESPCPHPPGVLIWVRPDPSPLGPTGGHSEANSCGPARSQCPAGAWRGRWTRLWINC